MKMTTPMSTLLFASSSVALLMLQVPVGVCGQDDMPSPLVDDDAGKGVVFDPLLTMLTPSSPPPPFDYYVLAQSWQPEFCHGKEHEYPGCVVPHPYWRTHFTMHGLWPELHTGKHPGFCGGDPFDVAAIERALGIDTLVEYWPDVKASAKSPSYGDFWKHEWTRHGTCSGLAQVTYFAQAINLLRNGTASTPTLVQENVGKSVDAQVLRDAFAVDDGDLYRGAEEEAAAGSTSSVAVLKCMPGNVLSQVFTCWAKDEQNRPTMRSPCSVHVLQEDTCHPGAVLIPAFPSES